MQEPAASVLTGCPLWRLQQTLPVGINQDTGLQDLNLSTWKEERPLAVNSHKIFSIKYIASIISTYQEKNVIASLRNVNSRLQF